MPVVGLVPNVKNAVIVCGGSCWGILNGPAMGQAAASLILGEAPPIDLRPFDPLRFDRKSSSLPSGLPPKLLDLLSQNPQLVQVLKQDPKKVAQLLEMFGHEDG